MTGQAKRAKVLTDAQQRAALGEIDRHRYPQRDRVILLLSYKAGLRAKEIAMVTWRMVTGPEGSLQDHIALENAASKGGKGGRTIPMHVDLRKALQLLMDIRGALALPDAPIIFSEASDRSTKGMSPGAMANWFGLLYRRLGFVGASSHSGRRTFITRAARKITEAGGSLRDVQGLAGHASITTTQLYIDESIDAKQKVIKLI